VWWRIFTLLNLLNLTIYGQKLILKTDQSIIYSNRLSGGDYSRVRTPTGLHAYWRNLAMQLNRPCMCGGDAALRQITLTTCYYERYCLNVSFIRSHRRMAQVLLVQICTVNGLPVRRRDSAHTRRGRGSIFMTQPNPLTFEQSWTNPTRLYEQIAMFSQTVIWEVMQLFSTRNYTVSQKSTPPNHQR